MLKRRITGIFLLMASTALVGSCDSGSPGANSKTSASGTALPLEASIEAAAERGPEGKIFITGRTNLPNGLKIGIEIPEFKWKEMVKDFEGRRRAVAMFSQDFQVIVRGGRFRSTGFLADQNPYPPGKHRVHFAAYFNGPWQSKDALNIIGYGAPS